MARFLDENWQVIHAAWNFGAFMQECVIDDVDKVQIRSFNTKKVAGNDTCLLCGKQVWGMDSTHFNSKEHVKNECMTWWLNKLCGFPTNPRPLFRGVDNPNPTRQELRSFWGEEVELLAQRVCSRLAVTGFRLKPGNSASVLITHEQIEGGTLGVMPFSPKCSKYSMSCGVPWVDLAEGAGYEADASYQPLLPDQTMWPVVAVHLKRCALTAGALWITDDHHQRTGQTSAWFVCVYQATYDVPEAWWAPWRPTTAPTTQPLQPASGVWREPSAAPSRSG